MTTAWLRWSGARPESGWQGIKRLELSLAPSDAAPTYAELVVVFLQPPSGLDEQSFGLTGGRRVRNIPWRIQAVGSDSMTLRLEAIGDHSTYTITLLDGGDLPLDPFFASADFTFTIHCERGDCRPSPAQAERERSKRPAVDLLTKDYTGFVNLLADRVRVTNPHWADLSPASLERVFLELISHHGDMLSYYQDRVANEAFLDDAGQRHSLRQHGQLLGYDIFDGAAAETVLAFTAATNGYVPKGIEVTMAAGADVSRCVFHVLERTRVRKDHSRLAIAAWPGARLAEIPEGSTSALLWDHVDELLPGQQLAFVQGTFAQVVTLTEVRQLILPGWAETPGDEGQNPTPSTDPAKVTAITWDTPLEAALRPWVDTPPFFLYGNLAKGRFGEQRTSRIPLSKSALSGDRQSVIVVREQREGGSVFLLRALRVPDGPVLFAEETSDAGAARGAPLIEVSLPQQRFYRVEHLHASQAYDAHYIATADEDGSLWLQFGDGRQGMSVVIDDPAPADMTLRYYVGDPIAGNCAANTLTQIVVPEGSTLLDELVGLTVTNVTPGQGGRQPETKEAARLAIPASLRHGRLERAVSLDDYARAARDVPGVARATARALGGAFNAVLVLVDPEGQAELSPSLRKAVLRRIEAVRMAGREPIVREPEYVPLEVKLAICVEPGALPHRVRDAVYAALRPGTRERSGFFHPDRLSFGEEVELGELLAHVQRVPGVRHVKALRFRKLRVSASGPAETRIRLRSTEVARLDADDDYPENGRLRVLVVGIDPGVSEKDFQLLEVT